MSVGASKVIEDVWKDSEVYLPKIRSSTVMVKPKIVRGLKLSVYLTRRIVVFLPALTDKFRIKPFLRIPLP